MRRKLRFDNGVYVGDAEGLFKPKRVGWGKMTYSNGDVYEGEWKHDKRDGEGKMTRANGDVSKGKWKDGRMVEGRVDYANGNYYEGTFGSSGYAGDGKLFIKYGGITYVGHFSGGKRYGVGKETCSEYTYKGRFANDRFHFEGKLEKSNGDWFDCTFYFGKPIKGRCRSTESDGSVYEGELNEEKYNGAGKMTLPDGTVYVGGFKDGKYHGEGTVTYPDGRVEKGEFEGGVLKKEDKPVAPAKKPRATRKTADAETVETAKKPRTTKKTEVKTESITLDKVENGKKVKQTFEYKVRGGEIVEIAGIKCEKLTPTIEKCFNDLEAAVKKVVAEANTNYGKVVDPKPVLSGMPLITPALNAKKASGFAKDAQRVFAKFEERAKKEREYGGALSYTAAERSEYDPKTNGYLIYKGGLTYTGAAHGYGRIEYPSKNVYEGEIDWGKLKGIGRLTTADYTYTGEFQDDKRVGVGVTVYNNGYTMMGQFEDGALVCGVRTNAASGERYEGEIKRGRSNGYGIVYCADIEAGFFFVENNFCGHGYYKTSDYIYRGSYFGEKKQGVGIIEYGGGIRYIGEVRDFKPHGKGRFDTPDSGHTIGTFENGEQIGYAVTVTESNKTVKCFMEKGNISKYYT